MSIDAMKQALDALEEMKAEFRALDLPYGSKAYTKANNSTHALRAAIEQAREWQGLTDDEMEGLYQMATYMDETDYIHMLMMAEAKLREKNNAR